MNALTATGHTEGSGKRLRRGTNHALACRGLHEVNAAQVLEMEEVQRGRGLRVAGGADLGGLEDQVGHALLVDGERAALQDAARERPRRSEVPITDEAGRSRKKRDDVRGRSEILRHVVRKTVRISEVDLDGHGRRLLRKGGQTSAATRLRHRRI